MNTFEELLTAAKQKELILLNGGMCSFHLCRNGRLTIYNILILPEKEGKGTGTKILDILKKVKNAKYLTAKCPADLPANKWYEKRGFTLFKTEKTKNGREVNRWVYNLENVGLLGEKNG